MTDPPRSIPIHMSNTKYIDPRGPSVKIVSVAVSPTGGPTLVSMTCGHVVERVNHFSYHVGDSDRCFICVKIYGRGVAKEDV